MRILYNSLETRYKTPFGTLFPRQDCRMRLAIPASCQTRQVTLVVEQENGAPAFSVSFSLQQREGPYEWYGGTFQIANLGLYFYYFRIETANETFRLFQQGEDTNMEAGGKWQLSCVTDRYPVPAYAQGAVMYQVFPDRFFQAGQPDLTEKLAPFRLHADRTETPDYRPDADGIVRNCDFYGGNFAGIAAKLPYLRALGVSLLYLNPIFKAYSNHRYDTCDYRQPDPMLGTAADFTALCEAAHRLGIRVILDGVFSHTGSRSIYFDRSGEFGGGACTGPGSPYYSWYTFQHFPDRYTSWWGIDTLPCVNELDPGYLDYIIDGPNSVVAHWLRLGADGYRLDVADELPDAFILRLKDRIRQVKPDALLIGEVWEDASNKIAYGKRRRYFIDGALDSVMNYPWRKAILDYCQSRDDGTALRQSVLRIAENYPPGVLSCVMNILGTHDTPRILSLLGGSCDGTKDEQAQRQLSSRQRAQALEQLLLLQRHIGHADRYGDGGHPVRGDVLIDGQDVGAVFGQMVDDRGEHARHVLHGHVEGDDGVGFAGIVFHHAVLIFIKGAARDVGQPHRLRGVCGLAGGDIFFGLQYLFKDFRRDAFGNQQIFFFVDHRGTPFGEMYF